MRKMLALALASTTVAFLALGCAHEEVKDDEAARAAQDVERYLDQGQPARDLTPPEADDVTGTGSLGEGVTVAGLKPIYFDFDRSVIRPDARATLSDNARYMADRPTTRVVIEGHCDERGTSAYNLALGQRRVESARQYLLSLGVSDGRLTTISYGEERPADPGHDEAAWAKNRRDEFVVQ